MIGFCRKVLISLTVISFGLLVISLVLALVIIPYIIELEVNKALQLENGTKQFDRFVKLPVPLYLKVYVFHVENSQDIVNNGSKPILSEKGPYIYKENRVKDIIGMDEDTVSYTQNITFDFDANASYPLKEDDFVTIINAPLMIIYEIAEDMQMSGLLKDCIKYVFQDYPDLFINVTIRQLLFDGVKFCDTENEKGGLFCALENAVPCKIAETKKNVDKDGKHLKFSFFNYKVKQNDGVYVVNRGVNDITQLGHIVRWNNASYTEFWGKNTICSQVKGCDSTIYPPRVKKDTSLDIYSTDICRYVTIDYKRMGSYKGIDGYVFEADENTFKSKFINPEEDCFCTNATKDMYDKSNCYLDGLLDLQTCTKVPVLLSFPHFLWANQYSDSIEGLKPNKSFHGTHVLIEPNTGTPLVGLVRVQLNMIIRNITGIPETHNMRRAVLPLIWLEEGASLDDNFTDMLNDMYFNKVKIVDWVKWTLVGLTTLCLVLFGGILLVKQTKKHIETKF